MFRLKYFPQATGSAIKQVSSTKRKKNVPKEFQLTSAENQQIAELLWIKKTGWWAVAEALAEKNARNSLEAIPKQTSTKQHSLSQQTSSESSNTEASSDSEEGIFMTLINVKNIRPNHTVVPVQGPNQPLMRRACARQKRSKQAKANKP